MVCISILSFSGQNSAGLSVCSILLDACGVKETSASGLAEHVQNLRHTARARSQGWDTARYGCDQERQQEDEQDRRKRILAKHPQATLCIWQAGFTPQLKTHSMPGSKNAAQPQSQTQGNSGLRCHGLVAHTRPAGCLAFLECPSAIHSQLVRIVGCVVMGWWRMPAQQDV